MGQTLEKEIVIVHSKKPRKTIDMKIELVTTVRSEAEHLLAFFQKQTLIISEPGKQEMSTVGMPCNVGFSF